MKDHHSENADTELIGECASCGRSVLTVYLEENVCQKCRDD